MREILFRGKRVDNGKWVQGYYTETLRYNNLHWIWDGKEYVKIDPKTIGQFTGLTDKNGTKIFEGDIGKNIDGLFLVRWDNEKCAFVMSFYDYPNEELYLEEMWEDSEIIGNIHDNAELIGGGENA